MLNVQVTGPYAWDNGVGGGMGIKPEGATMRMLAS